MAESIPGTNTLLLGPTGTGKTTAIRTFIGTGVTPFVIFTEQGMDAMRKSLVDSNKDFKDVHYCYVAPANPSFKDMISVARKINTMTYKTLCGLSDINKRAYDQYLTFLMRCDDFICDCCGKSWGSVETWNTDRALIIDGFSGLSIMSMDLMVGAKPAKSRSDWGVAMDNLERGQMKLTSVRCWYVLITHIERELDEITGARQIMVSTLGQKLAPKIPRIFGDVVETVREGDEFWWRTNGTNIDTKGRLLPIASKIEPSFAQIVESWKRYGGVIEPTKQPTSESPTP